MKEILSLFETTAKILLPRGMRRNLAWRRRQWRTQVYRYSKNKKKIEAVLKILADDYSRDTLNAYIEMCLTNDHTKLLALTRPKEKQYFDESVFTLGSDETFVDMGVLNAETSLKFAEVVNYQYDKILMFEPDAKSYERSLKNIQAADLKNAYLFPEGCGDCDKDLFFESFGAGNSRISQQCKKGSVLVKIVSLDRRLQQLEDINNITYIKMDIEGSESMAIEGSTETIRKYKPRLAVCIYHKPEDIFVLPQLIKSICPDYKLYIRHYNNYDVDKDTHGYKALGLMFELVCYAV